MSEKRFEVVLNEFDEVEYIIDKEMMEDRDFAEFMNFVEILAKENERLRSLHINLLETIVKEPFYQEIFKEFLLESPEIKKELEE